MTFSTPADGARALRAGAFFLGGAFFCAFFGAARLGAFLGGERAIMTTDDDEAATCVLTAARDTGATKADVLRWRDGKHARTREQDTQALPRAVCVRVRVHRVEEVARTWRACKRQAADGTSSQLDCRSAEWCPVCERE